jgi:WD40 repeat protein
VLAFLVVSTAHPAAPPAPRVDPLGDPLPPGALARLGTSRFRQYGATAAAISPDGKLAAGGNHGCTIFLWEMPSGRPRGEIQAGELTDYPGIESLAFSPDGRTLASRSGKQADVQLWDVSSGKRLVKLPASSRATGFAFSADGKTLAVARRQEGIAFYSAKGGKAIAEMTDRECDGGLVFSPDGKTLAYAKQGGTIVLWDVAGEKERDRFTGHTKGAPRRLTFSADGKALASGGPDFTVRVWDVAKARQTWKFDVGTVWTHDLRFIDKGKALLAVAHASQVRRYDLTTGKEAVVWEGEKDLPTWQMAFSQDGRWAAFGTINGPYSLRVLDLTKKEEVFPGPGHVREISGLAWSPDGKLVATSSSWMDPVVRLWDPVTGRQVREMRGNKGGIEAVAFSPDGRKLAGAGGQGAADVRLWWTEDGKLAKTLSKEGWSVLSLAWSPDGKLLAGGTYYERGSKLHVWDVEQGKPRQTLTHDLPIHFVGFSRDGRTLFSTSDALRVWDVGSGVMRQQVKGDGYFCALSPDARLVFRDVRRDGSTGVVEILTGKTLWQAKPKHRSEYARPPCVAFSPDGRLVAAGDHDGTVMLLDAIEGESVHETRDGRDVPISVLAFSPDGKSLAAGDHSSQVLIWDVRGIRLREPGGRTDLDTAYKELGDDDPKKAYRAIRRLAADPGRSVAYLGKRVPPALGYHWPPVARLLTDLDAEEFDVREQASLNLAELGKSVAPALRAALADKNTPLEARKRVQKLLDQIDRNELTEAQRRSLRAVAALERIGTDEARRILRRISAGHPDAQLTQEAESSLLRLARSR